MKRTPASPADTLSPLGGAVPAHDPAESAANDRDPVALSTPADEPPPVLAGHLTPALQARAESFYRGVAEMFERWAARRGGSHTRRAYRRDILSFVEFLGIRWPEQAEQMLRASVADVQRWRDAMREQSKAPNDQRQLNLPAHGLTIFVTESAAVASRKLLPGSGAAGWWRRWRGN